MQEIIVLCERKLALFELVDEILANEFTLKSSKPTNGRVLAS